MEVRLRPGLGLELSWLLLLGLLGPGLGLVELLFRMRFDLELARCRRRGRRRLLMLFLAKLGMECEDLLLGQGLLWTLRLRLATLVADSRGCFQTQAIHVDDYSINHNRYILLCYCPKFSVY